MMYWSDHLNRLLYFMQADLQSPSPTAKWQTIRWWTPESYNVGGAGERLQEQGPSPLRLDYIELVAATRTRTSNPSSYPT